jgi:formamidopyrimidine-DNA glycosylase
MPELPEVETVRTSLEPAIVGRSILDLRVGAFKGVVGDHDPDAVAARLRGRRVVGLRRRGKYLIADLDGGTSLLIHLRMTGNLVRMDGGAAPTRFEHLAIVLDDGSELRFADQRKFGRVLLVSAAEIAALDARLGPEPLAPGFTADALARSLARRTGRLKSVLLDQSFVAGLGNIYVDEALFRARLHPLRSADGLNADEVRRLHHAIRAVLREGLTNRGTTFSTFRDGYGASGSNQDNLRVYGRGAAGDPCPRCGGTLVRLTVGGRGSHLCPRCQPPPESTVPTGAYPDAHDELKTTRET